jgi:hypothetical protein
MKKVRTVRPLLEELEPRVVPAICTWHPPATNPDDFNLATNWDGGRVEHLGRHPDRAGD